MSLNTDLLRLWEAMWHKSTEAAVVPAPFWKEDNNCCTPDNGWEPLSEKGDLEWSDCNMVDQVVSDCGINLSHYRMLVPVKCILGTREVWQDYFEVSAVATTPATRSEPEDADPFEIATSGNLHGAMLEFLKAEMDCRLQGWAEAYEEHEWDKATGGEGGLGVF